MNAELDQHPLPEPDARHVVRFYDSEELLVAELTDYADAALRSGNAFVTIATPAHFEALRARLYGRGFDADAAYSEGRWLQMDCAQTLDALLRDGVPDAAAFEEAVAAPLAEICRVHGRARLFGEMVAVLCGAGDYAGAIRLEALWNDLFERLPIELLCACSMASLAGDGAHEAFARICAAHGQVLPAKAPGQLEPIPGKSLQATDRGTKSEGTGEQMKVEAPLEQREHELSEFLENDADPAGRLDRGGTVLWANRGLRDLMGAENPVGHTFDEFTLESAIARDIMRRLEFGERVRDLPLHICRGDDVRLAVLVNAIPCRDGDKLQGAWLLIREAAEQAKVERRLREEVDLLETLSQSGKALLREREEGSLIRAIVATAVQNTAAYCGGFIRAGNDARADVAAAGPDLEPFGDMPADAIGRLLQPIFDGERMLHSGDLLRHTQLAWAPGTRGDCTESLPMRSFLAVPVRAASGDVMAALFLGHPESDAFGRRDELIAAGIASQATFVVENVRLLEANRLWRRDLQRSVAQRTEELRRTELHLETLLTGITDYAIMLLDAEGRILTWNTGGKRILGYQEDEILDSHFSQFYTAEENDDGAPQRALRMAIEQGVHTIEAWRRRKDGTRFWASATLMPIRDDDGMVTGYAKVIRDLTEARMAEERLQQTQRMEVVGQLTGGIAHDFNNLLTIILGNVEEILRLNPDGAAIRTAAGRASEAAHRAATLTRQLLAFSRRQPLNPEPVNVTMLLAGMSDMLRRALGENVRVRTTFTGNWPCEVDAHQLESAILNLAINARDAMPDGGDLALEVSDARLDCELLGGDRVSGDYVVITLTDTGVGMPAEVLERACEPFFTTKPVGHGTGLGLSQVYGFVRQSGGQLTLVSQPGKGTTIRIFLPRVAENASGRVRNPASTASLRGTESVLMVEDDAGVRQYCAELLRDLGYAVLEAGDGDAALRTLDEHPEIALLLTDVGLPRMNGGELARHAQSRRPDLPVLFVSGYPRAIVQQRGQLPADIELLSKPYTRKQLAGRVRTLLDAKAARNQRVCAQVLLLEDDPSLRQLTGQLLQEAGLESVQAANLADTRAIIASGAPIDLAIVDMNLAGENGMDAIRELRATNPKLPVIIASGYGDAVQRDAEVDDAPTLILPKPYSLGALKRTIASLGFVLRAQSENAGGGGRKHESLPFPGESGRDGGSDQ